MMKYIHCNFFLLKYNRIQYSLFSFKLTKFQATINTSMRNGLHRECNKLKKAIRLKNNTFCKTIFQKIEKLIIWFNMPFVNFVAK